MQRTTRLSLLLSITVSAIGNASAVAQPANPQLPPVSNRTVDFVKDVQPILRERCFECHAKGNEEGGLNLALSARVREGGEHGPVVKPGDSAESALIQRVASNDEDLQMPPGGPRLSAPQIGLLRAWVDQGAKWPAGADVMDPRLERARSHWAFQRLSAVQPPRLAPDGWAQTTIDAFVLDRLNAQRLEPSPPLDAARLICRIHFDLVGLPPTPEEVARFVADVKKNRQQAIDALVDRLLGSRHYGERWGRHWLDVARYADSDGQEADRDRPHAYHYRDFVIHAFNNDLPFDTFVRWQIAGDEYEPDNPRAVAATGFLTAGPHTVLDDTFLEEERLRNRYNELDDIVSTLGSGLLGLTVGCARCHDHKFDAISSREYYRLLSAFHSGDRVKGKLPDGQEGFFFRDGTVQPKTTWLFGRGDFYDRDRQVRLGFPLVVSAGKDAEQYWAAAKSSGATSPSSTRQRRALADWITDTRYGGGPLLARVMVNRIWQHHFGHGLARTVNDFGVRGDRPTHPQLLEWLAHDLVKHEWKLKRLHRMIVRSAVYQQGQPADSASATAAKLDPDNRLLSRMAPRRLEAEILRDSMLSISGTLNLEPGGPGFKPRIPAEAILARNLKDGGYPNIARDTDATRRRSVYMFHKRLVPYPLMQAFDRPDLLQTCGRRQNTTVAPQALTLLNDPFVRSCADAFAKRLIDQCGDDDALLVHRGFELALLRAPTGNESKTCRAFITSQTRQRQSRNESAPRRRAVADYCQTLFGLNEFIYVD